MQTLTIDRTKEWTVDDYLLLGETTTPCQLINGELIMSLAPNPLHQIVASNLNAFLKADAKKEDDLVLFAPVDVFIDSKNVFQPDLLLLKKENRKFLTEKGIEGPPDMIAEIISPANSYTDRYEKKDAYQRFGVKEYWIVDPGNKTLEIYTGENWNKPHLSLAGKGRVSSGILRDLSFDLNELF